MDKPLNGGWICEKHDIGYKGKCPTCVSLERKPKVSKKNQKAIRQLLRKTKR
jgi:hypothetical protein